MAYCQPSDIRVSSELELCVKEILPFIKPVADDTYKRQNVINEIARAIQTDQSLIGASVKPFGSFASNLYTRWGDLDISIDLNQSSSFPVIRWRKLNVLQKIMWALQRAGVANKIEFVRHARVPLVVYQSKYYNISCDISIDNYAGYIKSYVLRFISNIDERFRELVLLIKEFAKAQHLNDPKRGTLNSYSLCLLIIFHFQTCRPAIFPPLMDLYEGSIVDDIEGHTTLRHVEDSIATKISSYRSQISNQRNKSSICQLLISFFDKVNSQGSRDSFSMKTRFLLKEAFRTTRDTCLHRWEPLPQSQGTRVHIIGALVEPLHRKKRAEDRRHTAKIIEECVGRLNKNDEQMTSITLILNEVSRRLSAIEDKLEKSIQEQQQGSKESQFSGLNAMASKYVISTYTGQWKPININNRLLWKAQNLLIEDPFEQTENAARAVDSRGLTEVSQTFTNMYGKLSSCSVPMDRTSLLNSLVRPEIRSQLACGRQPIHNQFPTRVDRIEQRQGYLASPGSSQHRYVAR